MNINDISDRCHAIEAAIAANGYEIVECRVWIAGPGKQSIVQLEGRPKPYDYETSLSRYIYADTTAEAIDAALDEAMEWARTLPAALSLAFYKYAKKLSDMAQDAADLSLSPFFVQKVRDLAEAVPVFSSQPPAVE